MIIDGLHIDADLYDIVKDLAEQLHKRDIQLINKVTQSSEDVMITCPYHKGGQERRPSAGIRKSDGLFHCFQANTEIITRHGLRRIGELQNKIVTILNGRGEWETTFIKCYGKAPLYKLTLEQDNHFKVLYTTAEHEWFVHNYSRTYTTVNLHKGMYLDGVICKPPRFELDVDGVIHGIVYGDGTRTVHYSKPRCVGGRITDKSKPVSVSYTVRIPKFTKKSKLVQFFQNNSAWSISTLVIGGKEYWLVRSKRLPLTHNIKCVPGTSTSVNYAMSFLAGYFACDGAYDLMTIYSAKPHELCAVQSLFISCGVSVRTLKPLIRVTNYSNRATGSTLFIYPQSLPDNFFLVDKPKQTKYSRFRWRVYSVESTTQIEEVYCCETSTRSFVLADNILTHNCLACGETRSFMELVSNCFGYDGVAVGMKWLQANYMSVAPDNRKLLELNLDRNNVQKPPEYVTEDELDSYRYIHPYMYKRGLTDPIIELFDIGYDPSSQCITFPIKDEHGNVLFVARRSVKTKYFNYPSQAVKPLYGVYEYQKCRNHQDYSDWDSTKVVVCESMLDALKCWTFGVYAVAMNGLGTSLQFEQLKRLECRKLILATDNDPAGRGARERILKTVKGKLITQYDYTGYNGKKDINDLTAEEFSRLSEIF